MAGDVVERSMTTKRRGRRRRNTPNLFSQPDINFSSGKYQRPSKNIDQQRLFSSRDPYARDSDDRQSVDRPRSVLGVIGRARELGQPAAQPAAQSVAAPMSPFDAIDQAIATGQPMTVPPGYAGGPRPPDPYAAYGGANPDMAIRNAAQLFSGSVAGNPFITPEELARMRAGYAPLEQGINPAFYRYTSPVIQQALAGLRQSVSYRPEDAEFIARQFTPGGLY